MLEGSN